MISRPRRNHTPAFKAKVALAASRAIEASCEQFDVPQPDHVGESTARGHRPKISHWAS